MGGRRDGMGGRPPLSRRHRPTGAAGTRRWCAALECAAWQAAEPRICPQEGAGQGSAGFASRAPFAEQAHRGPHARPHLSTRGARLATTRKPKSPKPARPPARPPTSRAARLPIISTSKTQRVTNGWLSTLLRSSLPRKSLAPHLRRRTHRKGLGWCHVLPCRMGAILGRVCGVRARGSRAHCVS